MEYSLFHGTGTQPFQFYGFDSTPEQRQQDVSHDTGRQYSIQALDPDDLLPPNLEFRLEAHQARNTHVLAIPNPSETPTNHIHSLPRTSIDSGIALGLDIDMPPRRRSSTEEKDMLTPARSRRQAQNRAAQRAFRERKEQHVRDLEERLNLLTTTNSSLQSDNEQLRLLISRTQAENEILRASAATLPITEPSSGSLEDRPLWPSRDSVFEEEALEAVEPKSGAQPTVSGSMDSSPPVHSHALSPKATWDLLQSHPRYQSGALDVGQVYARLRKLSQPDVTEPVFNEDDVRRLIEEVGSNSADELI